MCHLELVFSSVPVGRGLFVGHEPSAPLWPGGQLCPFVSPVGIPAPQAQRAHPLGTDSVSLHPVIINECGGSLLSSNRTISMDVPHVSLLRSDPSVKACGAALFTQVLWLRRGDGDCANADRARVCSQALRVPGEKSRDE